MDDIQKSTLPVATGNPGDDDFIVGRLQDALTGAVGPQANGMFGGLARFFDANFKAFTQVVDHLHRQINPEHTEYVPPFQKILDIMDHVLQQPALAGGLAALVFEIHSHMKDPENATVPKVLTDLIGKNPLLNGIKIDEESYKRQLKEASARHPGNPLMASISMVFDAVRNHPLESVGFGSIITLAVSSLASGKHDPKALEQHRVSSEKAMANYRHIKANGGGELRANLHALAGYLEDHQGAFTVIMTMLATFSNAFAYGGEKQKNLVEGLLSLGGKNTRAFRLKETIKNFASVLYNITNVESEINLPKLTGEGVTLRKRWKAVEKELNGNGHVSVKGFWWTLMWARIFGSWGGSLISAGLGNDKPKRSVKALEQKPPLVENNAS